MSAKFDDFSYRRGDFPPWLFEVKSIFLRMVSSPGQNIQAILRNSGVKQCLPRPTPSAAAPPSKSTRSSCPPPPSLPPPPLFFDTPTSSVGGGTRLFLSVKSEELPTPHGILMMDAASFSRIRIGERLPIWTEKRNFFFFRLHHFLRGQRICGWK